MQTVDERCDRRVVHDARGESCDKLGFRSVNHRIGGQVVRDGAIDWQVGGDGDSFLDC